jgi:hypothetical protein
MYDHVWCRVAVLLVSIEFCIDSIEELSVLLAINTRRM